MKDNAKNSQIATRYTLVEIELIDPSGEIDRFSITIVPDDQADFYGGYLGESTPLAEALMGRPAGAVASYYANGLFKVRIISVEVIELASTGQAAARRKAAVEEAITDAERTSAMIFATSVAGKWGDYDADGMIESWEKDDQSKDEPQ
jgi:hypothetical protein